jgi:hypothetical protein
MNSDQMVDRLMREKAYIDDCAKLNRISFVVLLQLNAQLHARLGGAEVTLLVGFCDDLHAFPVNRDEFRNNLARRLGITVNIFTLRILEDLGVQSGVLEKDCSPVLIYRASPEVQIPIHIEPPNR